MRILVISDSHGRHAAIEKAIAEQTEAKHIFFLGDRLADIEYFDTFFPDRIFHSVSGNCDFGSCVAASGFINLFGKNIFYTHGHLHGVKGGTAHIKSAARQMGADIVLYGHTHVANIEYDDGLYIVNPGSIGQSRSGACSYAVLDIINGQVMPVIIKV